MRAMILAAGLGTRLRPLTLTTPKPLLPVAGTPLIVWNLLLLRRHGIRQVMINLHHLGHLIEKELGDGSRLGMALTYSPEPVLLGTGGGLKQAEWFFEGEPFLVLNGDTLLELDLTHLLRRHAEHDPIATMVVREDPEVERWGVLEIDETDRVLRINGRGRQGPGALRRRMFAGVHVVHPRLLHGIPSGVESSVIDAYVRALAAGETVLSYQMTGYWNDVGTPDRYAEVQRDAEAGRISLAARQVLC
ncbi:nucleotidyltransferase family protein [Candidatus Nitrospira bockiana]